MKRAGILVATDTAVWHPSFQEGDALPLQRFESRRIRCAAAGSSCNVLALSDGEIIVAGLDGPRKTMGHLSEPIECLLLLSEQPLHLLVGTREARLYRIVQDNLTRVAAFDALNCRDKWHTPWGGPPSVRSLAATPDGWVYADIHVGSIMRSGDSGQTWQPVTPDLNEDVHQVATCPAAPDRIYANTARGVYVSEDRGNSWQHRAEDLGCRYGRAVAVAPEDPDLLLATVSDGPHGDDVHGQLWRSEDCGRSWQQVKDGYPSSTPQNINTHHVTFDADGAAWALADDTLHVGRDRATRWEPVWQAPEEPVMLAAPRQHCTATVHNPQAE